MSFLTPEHLIKELFLQPGDRVADVGCGTGVYTIALSENVGEMGQVYAIDVHRDALHTLRGVLDKRNIFNVDMVWADIEKKVPIESYSLDAVVLSNVMFQLDDIGEALKTIATLLKPEGQLLVVDWTKSHGGIGPHPTHVVSEEKAESLVQKYNFRVIKRLPAGEYHYAFIALSV